MNKKTLFILSILSSFAIGGLGGGVVSTILLDGYTSPDSSLYRVENAGSIYVEESDASAVVERVTPSIVSIVVKKESSPVVSSLFGDVDGYQDGETEEIEIGSGSGFIVSEDGMILTNRHVVADTEADYEVVLDNGDVYDAQVIDRDQLYDLALMQIEAEGLTPVEIGDSGSLGQGQAVLAIGNTVGLYPNTVTKGIISGLSRDLDAGYNGLIQTDAAINSGNSGGPLLNLAGQVIGVNTAVDRSGEGIGFAIPINNATDAIDSVKKNGYIARAGLGVRYQIINAEIAELNELEYSYGAYITGDGDALGVIPGGSADTANLQEGDIILEVDGTQVTTDQTLAELMAGRDIGEEVVLTVFSDGDEFDVNITLQELPNVNKKQGTE
jgi:S1-C subfamily serine protease